MARGVQGLPSHARAYVFAIGHECRERLYGGGELAVGLPDSPHIADKNYANIAYHYGGRGFFTYDEVIEMATEHGRGETIPPECFVEFDLNFDTALRKRWAARMRDRSKAEGRGGHDSRGTKETEKGRRILAAREALHLGLCPVCGAKNRVACGHGFEHVEKVSGQQYVDKGKK